MFSVFQVFIDFEIAKKIVAKFCYEIKKRNFAIENNNIYFQCPLHLKPQSLSTTILT